MKIKIFGKFYILKQETKNFKNFINEFEKFVLKAGKMFNNDIKKSLCEKTLNKQLANAALNINNTLSFEIYRVCLIAIDDYIA